MHIRLYPYGVALDRPWVEFESREALRSWLNENYRSSQGIWAVYPKASSGVSDMSWEVLVEECLCFGWIDSLPGKVDHITTRTYISPRKPRSGWSRRNQIVIESLIAQGRMHPAGEIAVERAKANGSWSLFDRAEDLVIPDELQDAFAEEPAALAGFEAYPERVRKALLQWYYTARTDATRSRRCAAIAQAAAEGVKPSGF